MTEISIHAPTRGATHICYYCKKEIIISIHAPTRGATKPSIKFIFTLLYFNPRSYERSDGYPNRFYYAVTLISIHAPTRGATLSIFIILQLPPISIHAPTRGATANLISITKSFNYFNPRSYERSDINI